MEKKTWKELVEMGSGTILDDWFDEGVRCIIMRGPSSLCAYLGVSIDHPLAGKGYDDVSIECHGGLTFSGEDKEGKVWPKGFYWYGWDYGHCDDYSFYYDNYPAFKENYGKKWLVEDVKEDMLDTIYNFKKLVRLAESISKA